MFRTLALAAVFAAGLLAHAAKAAEIYDWTWTTTYAFDLDSAGTMSGTLTVDAGAIIAITGSGDRGDITGLVTIGDNLFPLTSSGVSFAATRRGVVDRYVIRTSSAAEGPFQFRSFSGARTNDYGNFSSTLRESASVPEPMSLALLAFGLAALAAARRATR